MRLVSAFVLLLAATAGAETPEGVEPRTETGAVEAGDVGAAAEDETGAEDARTTAPEPARPATTASGKVELEEVEIRGELEKPKIFFILPKAEREAETRERRIRFYPDILEPLDKDRFEEEARVLYQHGIPAE